MMRLEQSKPLSEAPVNGGRNYNGPKVAKFLVGQVPTCTNGVTMAWPRCLHPRPSETEIAVKMQCTRG